MAKRRNRWCRDCGAESSERRPISKSGLCPACASTRLATAITEVRERKGDAYAKWREGMAKVADRMPSDSVAS